MTIKAIKEQYRRFECGGLERNCFVVYDFNDGNGKVVIIVTVSPNKYVGKYVTGVVRVSDGINLIPNRCRPCDNLEDAIDVAGEMIGE